jgi:hypothetical protein
MREFLGICLGVLVIGGIGATSIGVVDSRSGAGLEGTATGTICMDNNRLYLDENCDDVFITGEINDQVSVYVESTTTPAVQFGKSVTGTTTFWQGINLINSTLMQKFDTGKYGYIAKSTDDGQHLCYTPTDGEQNNYTIHTIAANCAVDHNNATPATHPTDKWYSSTAIGSSDTEWGQVYHDTDDFVIESNERYVWLGSPVRTDGVDLKNWQTLTGDATLNDSYNITYLDGTSNDVTATLPSASACLGQQYRIKRVDGSTFAVSIASGDNIDGSATKSLSQYDSVLIHCDSSTYWVH